MPQRSRTGSALVLTLLVVSLMLLTADSPYPLPFLDAFNPRALIFEQGSTFRLQSGVLNDSLAQEDLWLGFGSALPSWNGDWLATHGVRGGFWGAGISAARGLTHVPLFDLPTQPLLSVTSLRHAPVSLMADEPASPLGNSRLPLFVQPLQPVSLQQLNAQNMLLNWRDARTPWRRSQRVMSRLRPLGRRFWNS